MGCISSAPKYIICTNHGLSLIAPFGNNVHLYVIQMKHIHWRELVWNVVWKTSAILFRREPADVFADT